MASSETVSPEKKAYLNDRKFRAFCEVYALDMPKLTADKVVIEYEERVSLQWSKSTKKKFFDENNNETKALKEAFRRWSQTKQAWRLWVPRSLAYSLFLLGIGLNPLGAEAEEQQLNKKAPTKESIGLRLVLYAVISVLLVNQWPLWSGVVDPEVPTLYSTLGLTPSATHSEVRSAWKQLALVHHPDQGGDPATFRAIKSAYEELMAKDPDDGFSDVTKENNLQVVVFFGFILGRMQETSNGASAFIRGVLDTRDGATNRWIVIVIYIVTIFFHLQSEGRVHLGHLPLLFNSWSYVISVWQKVTLSITPDSNHVAWETRRYLSYCIFPATVTYWILVYLGQYRHGMLTLITRTVLGVVYTCAFIFRHRLYVFLNLGLLSQAYAGPNPIFQRTAMFGFLRIPAGLREIIEICIDDIMAYCLGVPSPYRAMYFGLYFLSCAQRLIYPPMGMLPWGSPQKWDQALEECVSSPEEATKSAERKNMDTLIDEAIKSHQEPTLDAKGKKAQRKLEAEEEKRMRKSFSTLILVLGGLSIFCGSLFAADLYFSDSRRVVLSPSTLKVLQAVNSARSFHSKGTHW